MVHVEHTLKKMELTGKNPRTTLYLRITAKKMEICQSFRAEVSLVLWGVMYHPSTAPSDEKIDMASSSWHNRN